MRKATETTLVPCTCTKSVECLCRPERRPRSHQDGVTVPPLRWSIAKAGMHHMHLSSRVPSFGRPRRYYPPRDLFSTCFTKVPYRAELRLRYNSRSLSHALSEVSAAAASECGGRLTSWPDAGITSKTWEDEWLKSGWVRAEASQMSLKHG
jgi:hypothetical protein